jgi:hypothetical protein
VRVFGKVVIGFVAALLGVIWGGWWTPFVVGIAFATEERRARVALPAGALIGLFAWLVPLAVAHARYGVGPTAGSLGAIMGFGHVAAVPVILTLLVGSLLGLTGAWLGCSFWAVVAPHATVDDSTR